MDGGIDGLLQGISLPPLWFEEENSSAFCRQHQWADQ